MERNEIAKKLEELLAVNEVAMRYELRRLEKGLSRTKGNQLVQAISAQHKILTTLAKIEGYIPSTNYGELEY